MKKQLFPSLITGVFISAILLPQLTSAAFLSVSNYPIGNNPTLVKTADFNGDDFPDAAVINNADDTVTVFLNNGSGTLALSSNYTTGDFPSNLALTDVNNDLNIDIITVGSNNNTFSVFINNGDGTFAAQEIYLTGGGPIGLATYDINEDGFQDIVIAEAISNLMVIHLNAGDGTFTSSDSYPIGNFASDILIEDFNGDNAADIIVLNTNDENLLVFLNDGDSTFTDQAPIALGTYAATIKSADFDNDSDFDLAMPFTDDDAIGVRFNNGDGTFSPAELYPVADYPLYLETYDVNQDGQTDLISTSLNGNEFRVLFNSNGEFDSIASDSLPGAGLFGVTAANLSSNLPGSPISILVVGNTTELLYAILTDYAPPVIAEVTPVPSTTTDTTPSYTFSSTEAGTIVYLGDCSSATSSAVIGNNTITFEPLALGAHTNCIIYLFDSESNVSLELPIPSFTIVEEPAPIPEFTGSGAGGDFGRTSCSGDNCQNSESGSSDNSSSSDNNDNSSENSQPFTDIQNHWAKSYIEDLQESCNLTGYTDSNGKPLNIFKPDSPISRAELVTLIIRCQYGKLSNSTTSDFSDLPSSHWSSTYVKKALELGLISGFPDNTFRPDQAANRAEALKIILLANFQNSSITSGSPSILCQDLEPSVWYERYFSFALSKNIISGYRDTAGNSTGECGPANTLTRAEAAKIITLANEK